MALVTSSETMSVAECGVVDQRLQAAVPQPGRSHPPGHPHAECIPFRDVALALGWADLEAHTHPVMGPWRASGTLTFAG
jgi:hypothetical protein